MARHARSLPLGLLALALASCGPRRTEIPVASIPLPVLAPPPAEVPVIPLPVLPPAMIGESKGEDLWHLRSALNVAVLLCKGADNQAMVASYNRTLTVHKALLALAAQTLAGQYKIKAGSNGQKAYDDHMTRVYNSYSGTLNRDRFCARARAILNETQDATSDALDGKATAMLWDLNNAAGLPDPDGALARAARLRATAPSPSAAQPSSRQVAAETASLSAPQANILTSGLN